MIANFTPVSAAVGGVLIGLAATLLMLFNGRVAGISGILGGLLRHLLSTDHALAFSASLAFEQSYGGIDGDSASCAESAHMPTMRKLYWASR